MFIRSEKLDNGENDFVLQPTVRTGGYCPGGGGGGEETPI